MKTRTRIGTRVIVLLLGMKSISMLNFCWFATNTNHYSVVHPFLHPAYKSSNTHPNNKDKVGWCAYQALSAIPMKPYYAPSIKSSDQCYWILHLSRIFWIIIFCAIALTRNKRQFFLNYSRKLFYLSYWILQQVSLTHSQICHC